MLDELDVLDELELSDDVFAADPESLDPDLPDPESPEEEFDAPLSLFAPSPFFVAPSPAAL